MSNKSCYIVVRIFVVSAMLLALMPGLECRSFGQYSYLALAPEPMALVKSRWTSLRLVCWSSFEGFKGLPARRCDIAVLPALANLDGAK